MTRINWQAVVVGRVTVSAFIDGPDALVAIPAERTERAEHELVVIAAMPWVVIGDRRRGEASSLEAESAERLELKLVPWPVVASSAGYTKTSNAGTIVQWALRLGACRAHRRRRERLHAD